MIFRRLEMVLKISSTTILGPLIYQFLVPTDIFCLILNTNTNNHFIFHLPSFHYKILTSLNGVFWNKLTSLETLICHISPIFEKDPS